MIIDLGYWSKVLKRLTIFLFTLLGIYILIKLFVFFMPFLIALVIASLMEPFIRFITKKTKFTRKTCAIIALIIVFSIICSLLGWGITIVITESTKLLTNLNEYIEIISSKIDFLINNFDMSKIEIPEELKGILENSSNEIINTGTNYVKNFLTSILNTITMIPTFFIYLVITILATYFICTDRLFILDELEHHFPKFWVKKFNNHFKEICNSLGCYLKAEVILIIISFIIVLIGLYIFKFIGFNISYPLLVALGIGFIDALPILGSGTVMVPWGIITGLNGDFNFAVAIIVLYLIVVISRQLIEPRIVSGQIGIHPLFTLIAMYAGFKIIGVLGLIVGPIVLIIYNNIFSNMIDRGVVKTIFERK